MVFKERIQQFKRILVALLLIASSAFIVFAPRSARADILDQRSIQLSSSANGATDVFYAVQFDVGTTGTVSSIAIDFCSNSPILGDSCTAPASFDINEAGLVISGETNINALTVDSTTDTNTLILQVTSPASISAGTTVSFVLGDTGGSDGVTNPATSNTTFYARILTYADNDDDGNGCDNTDDSAVCYASTTPRIYIDAGGIAMSTAAQITITSRVQERLTFCVYIDATLTPSNDCTGKTGSAISLGDVNGVLTPTGPYVDKTSFFGITTNASYDAIVRLTGPTLTTGSFSIDAVGATPALGNAGGTEQFGLCAYQQAGTGVTVDPVYDGDGGGTGDCSTTSQTSGTGTPGGQGAGGTQPFFAFDDSGSGTTSTYGDTLATKTAGAFSTVEMAFIGNIANTTEAGIYTTTLTYIATGTY